MDYKNDKTPEISRKTNISNNVASKEEEVNNKFDENVVATQPLIQEPGWSNTYIPPQSSSNNIQEQPLWNRESAPPPCYQETTQTFVQEDNSCAECLSCCLLCTEFLELCVACCECFRD